MDETKHSGIEEVTTEMESENKLMCAIRKGLEREGLLRFLVLEVVWVLNVMTNQSEKSKMLLLWHRLSLRCFRDPQWLCLAGRWK
jgi:hypothetical protein